MVLLNALHMYSYGNEPAAGFPTLWRNVHKAWWCLRKHRNQPGSKNKYADYKKTPLQVTFNKSPNIPPPTPVAFLQTSNWATSQRRSWLEVTVWQVSWRLAASSPSVWLSCRPAASRLSTQISSASSSESTDLPTWNNMYAIRCVRSADGVKTAQLWWQRIFWKCFWLSVVSRTVRLGENPLISLTKWK